MKFEEWVKKNPAKFTLIVMFASALLRMIMGGHQKKSTLYAKKEIRKFARKHRILQKYVKEVVRRELEKAGIYYVKL